MKAVTTPMGSSAGARTTRATRSVSTRKAPPTSSEAGSSYHLVLPASLLVGGAFLVLTDLVARVVLAPAELPIGVVTAFIGAPFFAGLLWVGARRR